MINHLKKLSKPRRGLKKEIWLKLRQESGIALPRFSRPLVFQPAFLALVLFLLGSFGAGAYAYESPNVVEDHLLYPIKQGVEKLELRLARSQEKQSAVKLKLVERRLREAEFRAAKKQVLEERFLDKIENEIQAVDQLLADVPNPEKRAELRNHLEGIRVNRIQRVEKLIQDKKIKNEAVIKNYQELKAKEAGRREELKNKLQTIKRIQESNKEKQEIKQELKNNPRARESDLTPRLKAPAKLKLNRIFDAARPSRQDASARQKIIKQFEARPVSAFSLREKAGIDAPPQEKLYDQE